METGLDTGAKGLRIGLLGGMRSGKDTVAQMLTDRLDGETVQLAFSTGIHEVIQNYMPHLYESGKPRKALQEIGQLLRQFDPDVWVNRLFKTVAELSETGSYSNILVTDVRQPNEVARLRAEGFVILKVTAPMEVRLQRAKQAGDNFSPEMFQHETERDIDSYPYDYLIDNAGDLQELEDAVAKLIDCLRRGIR